MRLHSTKERNQKYKCHILGKTKTVPAKFYKFNIIWNNIFSESLVKRNYTSYLIIVIQLVMIIILMSSLKINLKHIRYI